MADLPLDLVSQRELILGQREDVRNVDRAAIDEGSERYRVTPGCHRQVRCRQATGLKFEAVRCDAMAQAIFLLKEPADLGVTEPRSTREDRVQRPLQVVGRGSDGPEDLAGRRPLLQCL